MPPKRKIVAVIEDDPSVRRALDRQVTAAGYRCHAFASAEEFLIVAAVVAAAGIVCDVHLGGISGLELAVHPTIVEMRVPVVLISGSGNPRVEESARLTAAAFLPKPIPPGELLEILVDIVGPPLAEDED